MSPSEIYLDNNATTQPLPEVRQEMLHVLGDGFGNASSVHTRGDRARASIRTSRENVSALLGTRPEAILFTSGATESNNLVIASALPATQKSARPRWITSAVEHSSILNAVRHWADRSVEVVVLPVDAHGCLDLNRSEDTLTPDTTLVSIQWANNETGVIQPIAEIARICQAHGAPLHADAAQALGKLDINLEAIPVDFLSATAHKLHGPTGCGLLYARDRHLFSPSHFGGPQEFGLRPGTENLPGIVGFGVAAQLRLHRFDPVRSHCRTLRDRFEQRILSQIPDVTINGDRDHRLDNTTNLRFLGVDGQALVARLDQQGICCSQSSACTNQRPEPSYVLRGMGLSEADAYASVRFSVSELNTIAEIETAADAIAELCRQQRAFRARLQVVVSRGIEVV